MGTATPPSVEYLASRLRYDPATGLLYWRASADMSAYWVSRYAGREAGGAHNAGYVRVRIFGVGYLAHRIAWALHEGAWPLGDIDHINGNKVDNRIENLRVVVPQENLRNAAISRNNKSGVNGVCWCANRQKWQAAITIDRKSKFLGYFDTVDAAAKVRKAAERRYGFHPNHGRKQPDKEVSGSSAS